MNSERWILIARIAIALFLGLFLFRFADSEISRGDIGGAILVGGLVAVYGVVLFLLFGSSFMGAVSRRFENLYVGRDDDVRIVSEYSIAEARVNRGKYQEAIDEYRKVIVEYPEDIYPHLRIAEVAVKHLNDVR